MQREEAQKVVDEIRNHYERVLGQKLELVDYFLHGFTLALDEAKNKAPQGIRRTKREHDKE